MCKTLKFRMRKLLAAAALAWALPACAAAAAEAGTVTETLLPAADSAEETRPTAETELAGAADPSDETELQAGRNLADGAYLAAVTLSGGSGKTTVESPAELTVADGEITAAIVFSSPNYDYMLIGDQRYEPVNTEGNSTFEIPVAALDEELPVIADTTAMSEPHEIEYTLYFDSATLSDADEAWMEDDGARQETADAPGQSDADEGWTEAGSVQPDEQAAEGVAKSEEAESAEEQEPGQTQTPQANEASREEASEAEESAGVQIAASGGDWCGLTWERSLDLAYATQFAVDYYEGGYARIVIAGTDVYLLVPENAAVPEQLDDDVVILQQPLDRIYLLATSAMDFFCSLDALDAIRLTGTEADGWYIGEARAAMEDGGILYAGKYSAPDYEMVLSEDCDLAIESTMIYHTPEVKEELEALGIPVLVERSSYEDHPLGRMEWIKFYAALLGLEEEAEELFDAEAAPVEELGEEDPLGKTVVFFYIQSDGVVNVRRPNDYISKMIEMAGGTYLFQDLAKEDSSDTAISMTVEEFYAEAKDADYLIYNSTTGGELYTVDELLSLSPLLADFKAVQEGNAWCTGKNLFQETMSIGDAIYQMHEIFSEEDPDPADITYLHRLTE